MKKGIIILVIGVLIASISQVMLKISAKNSYKDLFKEYLNPLVLGAYGMLFITSLISVYALRTVPLSVAGVIESLGQLFVAGLSFLLLKEHINIKKLIGLVFIIIGVTIIVYEKG